MPDLNQTPTKIPFITNKIKSAVRNLMNNKEPIKDEISAKLIKSVPYIVYEQIAKTYNNITETSEHPNHITNSILRFLQRPGKP